MTVIDMHAHVFPDAIAEAAVSMLVAEGGVRAYYDGTVDGLLALMDRGGIDRSVVVPVATKPTQVSGINDWVAALPRDRFIPFGAMHPDFENPAAEIARFASLGIAGIKLHSQHQDFLPQESRMEAIYRAAAEHDIILFFHAGGYLGEHDLEARPVDFAAMLDAHPDVTCVLAHMGGYVRWDEVREHLLGRNVYFDTAYCPRNLPDDEFLSMAREHGIERILFGSDGPWTDAGAEVAYLQSMGFTGAELDAILHTNAERLLHGR